MKFSRLPYLLPLLLALSISMWAQQAQDDDLDQTITFTLPAQVTANTTATLNGVASSGLPVSYTSLTAAVCTVAGNQVSYLTVGTCQIRATQAGNAQYEDADPVTRTTTVVGQPQTISFTLPALVTSGTTGTLTGTATSSLPVTYSSSTPAVCTIAGSTVSYLTTGVCTIVANQAGNQLFAAATAVTQSTTVNAPGSQPQTINFTLPAQVYRGTSTVLSGTATSGLPVQYSSSTPSVCTIANNSVNYLTTG